MGFLLFNFIFSFSIKNCTESLNVLKLICELISNILSTVLFLTDKTSNSVSDISKGKSFIFSLI